MLEIRIKEPCSQKLWPVFNTAIYTVKFTGKIFCQEPSASWNSRSQEQERKVCRPPMKSLPKTLPHAQGANIIWHQTTMSVPRWRTVVPNLCGWGHCPEWERGKGAGNLLQGIHEFAQLIVTCCHYSQYLVSSVSPTHTGTTTMFQMLVFVVVINKILIRTFSYAITYFLNWKTLRIVPQNPVKLSTVSLVRQQVNHCAAGLEARNLCRRTSALVCVCVCVCVWVSQVPRPRLSEKSFRLLIFLKKLDVCRLRQNRTRSRHRKFSQHVHSVQLSLYRPRQAPKASGSSHRQNFQTNGTRR